MIHSVVRCTFTNITWSNVLSLRCARWAFHKFVHFTCCAEYILMMESEKNLIFIFFSMPKYFIHHFLMFFSSLILHACTAFVKVIEKEFRSINFVREVNELFIFVVYVHIYSVGLSYCLFWPFSSHTFGHQMDRVFHSRNDVK